MTSRSQVFGRPLAFASLLVALACQRESGTDFDDSHLPGTGATASGGSPAKAGEGPGAAPSTGGTDMLGEGGAAAGGEGEVGGTATAGNGGKAGAPTAGDGGKPAGGASMGGGGSAGASMAGGGSGGKPADPDPIPGTVTITDIDDAHVASCAAYMNYGDAEKLMVDGNFGCSYAALIDPALEKFPSAAQIKSAKLRLSCTNPGGAITVSYVDEAWAENTVRYSTRPKVGEKIGSVTCDAAGLVEIDVMVALKAWLAGEHEAFGVYLQTTSSDGTDFASSESDDAAVRPSLFIDYLLPPT